MQAGIMDTCTQSTQALLRGEALPSLHPPSSLPSSLLEPTTTQRAAPFPIPVAGLCELLLIRSLLLHAEVRSWQSNINPPRNWLANCVCVGDFLTKEAVC